MSASRVGLALSPAAASDPHSSVTRWTALDWREYLESREGKIWRREDTLRILERAEQIEALIIQLMQAAGIEIVGS